MKQMVASLGVFFSIAFQIWANDTLFIRSIELPGRVRNIDYDGRHLLVRLENGLYLYKDGKIEKLDIPLEARYSWFTKSSQKSTQSIYHTEYIFEDKMVRKGDFDHVLPGFFTHNMTYAILENTLFISYRGALLQYFIGNDISFSHRGKSVRHVYNNDSIRIVCTYSGIYMDKVGKFTDRLLRGSKYSNGELSEINGEFYLCQDLLFKLEGDTTFAQVGIAKDGASFRKLIQWNGETISLFNKRISRYNIASFLEKEILLDGEEFNDMEIFDGNLLGCSTSGLVYRIHPNGKTDTLKCKGALYDLQAHKNEVIVSSDSGLFTITKEMQVLPITRGLQAIQTASFNESIFISSLNGLYLLRQDTFHTLIPNVEFNKRALSIFNNHLYAGSVDGLYIIQLMHFDSKILPTLTPFYVQLDTVGWPPGLLIGMVMLLALVAGTIAYLLNRRRNTPEEDLKPIPDFSPALISNTIRDNEDITTVQSLSEKLDISVVQLNRKLKPFGETPLSLMQKVKKEIALDMQAKGFTVEQISKRTGYSKRYIREHFLK